MAERNQHLSQLAERVRKGISASPSGAPGFGVIADASAALNDLVEQLQSAQEEVEFFRKLHPTAKSLAAERDGLKEQFETLQNALAETPCVLHCNEIGECAEFGFVCRRCQALIDTGRLQDARVTERSQSSNPAISPENVEHE